MSIKTTISSFYAVEGIRSPRRPNLVAFLVGNAPTGITNLAENLGARRLWTHLFVATKLRSAEAQFHSKEEGYAS